MKADDLARFVREGAGTFRIDKIAVSDAGGSIKFRGTGLLRITAAGLTAELALWGSAPPFNKRVLTEKDYWKLRGVIAGRLRFSSAYITPIAWLGEPKQVFDVTRTLHAIELVTKKIDPVRIRSQNRAQRRRFKMVPQPRSKPGSDRSFLFHAVFVDHPLPGANAGTQTVNTNEFFGERPSWSADTLIGDTFAGDYALVRASNDKDLELYFRSKPNWKSPGEDDDRRKFQALLHGLAFSTGIQPWPFRTTYSRGRGFVISDTLNAAERPPRTVFAPLNVNFGKEGGAELANAIRAAAEFLEADSALNRKLLHLLFLFRQAGAAQEEIAILTVCTLLESLVRTIFKHVCDQKSGASDALEAITLNTLKDSFLRRVSDRAESGKGREYERLYGRIRDTQVFEIRDIFRAVATRLDISWKDEMEPIFKEWKKARNPSAHGAFRHDVVGESAEQQEAEKTFYGHSRIAGAFNMILLKLFGYTGSYVASVIEGTRQTVK